jgi:hypothetical protein
MIYELFNRINTAGCPRAPNSRQARQRFEMAALSRKAKSEHRSDSRSIGRPRKRNRKTRMSRWPFEEKVRRSFRAERSRLARRIIAKVESGETVAFVGGRQIGKGKLQRLIEHGLLRKRLENSRRCPERNPS